MKYLRLCLPPPPHTIGGSGTGLKLPRLFGRLSLFRPAEKTDRLNEGGMGYLGKGDQKGSQKLSNIWRAFGRPETKVLLSLRLKEAGSYHFFQKDVEK